MFTPQPRFRMYSSLNTYLSLLKEVALGRKDDGDDCERLEKEVRLRSNMPFSVCVPQARVGIYLAAKAVIKPGQKVILSPYTVADVINMVICAGGVPVFADIERNSCNIDPEEIARLIDDQTGAVLITHLHGLACSLDEIVKTCRKRNIYLIEDAAQAFGARFEGRWVGSFGDLGIYSFGRYKNIISFYGGMVVTHHAAIHQKIRDEIDSFPYMEAGVLGKRVLSCLAREIATYPVLFQLCVYQIFQFGYLHNIGMIKRYVETELDLGRKETIPESYLRRMMPAQARIVLSKIDQVARDTAIRIKYARIYYEGLSDLSELILPPLRTDGSHIYTSFPIQYSPRDSLVRWVMEHRRDVGVQHLKNCADLPAFSDHYRECPKARATARDVILLPTYPRYSEEEVRRNIKVIREFFRK